MSRSGRLPAGGEGDPACWLRLAGAEAGVRLGEDSHPVLVGQPGKVVLGEDGNRQPGPLGPGVAIAGELGDLLDVEARAVQAAAGGFPGRPGPPAGAEGGEDFPAGDTATGSMSSKGAHVAGHRRNVVRVSDKAHVSVRANEDHDVFAVRAGHMAVVVDEAARADQVGLDNVRPEAAE